jgi:hypothetical protein
MATILQTTDFNSGDVKISQQADVRTALEAVITVANEKEVLWNLLGPTEGQAFIDDLSGDPAVPVTAKYQTIFNQLTFSHNDYPITTLGLKEIMKYWFYIKFVRDQSVVNTAGGNRVVLFEASEADTINGKLTIINNRMVEEVRKLWCYISDNSDTYTDFQAFGNHWMLDTGI